MRSLPAELYGGVLILIAMAILGLSDNLFYFIQDAMGLGQFHAIRSFLSACLILPFALYMGIRLWPQRPYHVLARTCLQTISMFLYFGSLPIMTVAEAAAGLFTSPIFVLLFTALIYREPIGWRRISAVAIGTCGVVVVLQPGQNGFHLLQLMPVAAGAFYAMASMVTRRWCAEESSLSVTMNFLFVIGLSGAAASIAFGISPLPDEISQAAPFLFRGWMSLSLEIWGWMAIQALASVIAITLLTKGYQVADTSYVAIFEYSLLIFASLWTFILWGEALTVTSFVGFVMIAVAGTIISRRTALKEAQS